MVLLGILLDSPDTVVTEALLGTNWWSTSQMVVDTARHRKADVRQEIRPT